MDTGTDVNCMNDKTFNELFPEVQLSVCPHKIQNFGNSVADISILGQLHTYLEFRGEKYLNTFIVTNANDCPNLLSYGATLLPNYPEENVVKGDRVPNFSKMNRGKTGNGTSHGMQNGISYASTGNSTPSGTANGTSNIFQILNDKQKRQRAIQYQYYSSMVPTVPETETSFRTTTPSAPAMQHIQYQYNSSMVHNMVNSNTVTSTVPTVPEMANSFRTTTPSTPAMAATMAKQLIQYMYTKILHGVDLQHTVHMSTNLQNRFADQVNH